MLGWEYPPHIAGGLGTACEGLTKGLARQGTDVTFVVPRLFGDEQSAHMHLIEPKSSRPPAFALAGLANVDEPRSVDRVTVPAFLAPYWSETEYEEHAGVLEAVGAASGPRGTTLYDEIKRPAQRGEAPQGAAHYGEDIFAEVSRYAYRVASAIEGMNFDVVHAHDWMTYPAGIMVAELTGKPLVVHVHSIEHDRSGHRVNDRICGIEKMGCEKANAVIPVSHYTKSLIHNEYGIPTEKIHVVHNGIYAPKVVHHYRARETWPSPVVLFLGRITFQKGPDYFVRAAAKVIPHVPDVVFVMAGDGDMRPRMMALAKELDIEDHFRFPGFLNGELVEEAFSVANLYVMPSVSEPFGLSALEAVNFSIPALISKQSGVSEVLANSLKFDFWDVDRLADLIINGLLHEEMRAEMTAMAKQELKHLHWDASAKKTVDVYKSVA